MLINKLIPLFASWGLVGASSYLLLKTGGYTIRRVEGPSMRPTFNPKYSYFNDYILLKKVDFHNKSNLIINSIICVKHPKRSKGYLIKRLIANENETVVLSHNSTTNNRTIEKLIPEGHCWIQSDAGPGYLDSTSYLGPISYDKVVGKALYVIWPPVRVRKL